MGSSATDLSVSFEFFPPRTEEAERSLWRAVERLAPLGPRFVSVTYGAGGSTRERTHATVTKLQRETNLQSAAHLTCVGATRSEIDSIARHYWDHGIRHVVALRGDPPEEIARYEPHRDGYAYAVDLVIGLRRIAEFEISVAAYPETHPEAANSSADLDNLKRKIDAGASRAITQFFFEPETFLRFRDRTAAAGIDVPLVPGVLPVTNFTTVKRFAAMCGAGIPDRLARRFDGLDHDADTRKLVAASVAIEHCDSLRAHGVNHFHFYTLNRAELTYAICHTLGLRPDKATTK